MAGIEWLAVSDFASHVGIGRRSATAALTRCATGLQWRGHALEIRRTFGRGGKSGLSYEVSLRSLSEAFEGGQIVERIAPLKDAPFRRTAQNQSAIIGARWTVIEEAALWEPGTAERAAAIARILARDDAPPERTLRRWLSDYDAHGMHGLARKKPSNAGARRVVVSTPFDKAFRAAGHSDELLYEIGAKVEQRRKDIWASPAQRAGCNDVKRRLEFELSKFCRAAGVSLPRAAMRVSRRMVEVDRDFRQVDIMKHDAKRFHDATPHVIRDNLVGPPMARVVADVKHVDVVLTRPDGSEAYPKVVGFMDRSTGRIFLYPILLDVGEGVRQEHVIEAFIAMVEAWGFPKGLYLDNGTEFACFEKIRSAFQLVSEEAGRDIIYARPYNAKAKTIEGWFKRADQYMFSVMPGYLGGDRMNKKTQKVGRPTKPYCGSWSQWCEELKGLEQDFNARPIGGQWQGRSADEVHQEKVSEGWRPTVVETMVLDAAFSTRETRRLDRGGLKIRGVRHHHPLLDGFAAGSTVDLALSWRRGADPLFRTNSGQWAYALPDFRYHPEDIEGAKESGRRGRRHLKAVRDREKAVASYDPVAATLEMVAARPKALAALPGSRLGGSSETIELAAGRAQANAERKSALSAAQIQQRREERETERLERMYANGSR